MVKDMRKKQCWVVVGTDGSADRRLQQTLCLSLMFFRNTAFVLEHHDGPASWGVKSFIGSRGISDGVTCK